jgi:hypothetical protein
LEGQVIINGGDIANLNGLSILTSIGGDIRIWGNNPLTSLAGLENVTSIGGSLIIGDIVHNTGNPSLTSLTGLNNLTSIGGDLKIHYNDSLTSLMALNNLISVGGGLYIGHFIGEGNPLLTSLAGLDNIDAGSITGLGIWGNSTLSTCEVQSICDYLTSPNGSINIYGNGPGCSNRQQVEAACAAISLENQPSDKAFSIYPNPSSTKVTIETSAIPTKSQVFILNLSGQELITRQITEPKAQIDISTLPSGIYFVKILGDKTIQIGKIIKE